MTNSGCPVGTSGLTSGAIITGTIGTYTAISNANGTLWQFANAPTGVRYQQVTIPITSGTLTLAEFYADGDQSTPAAKQILLNNGGCAWGATPPCNVQNIEHFVELVQRGSGGQGYDVWVFDTSRVGPSFYWPAEIQDLQAAVWWMAANAGTATYPGNPMRIFLNCGSSGAQTALIKLLAPDSYSSVWGTNGIALNSNYNIYAAWLTSTPTTTGALNPSGYSLYATGTGCPDIAAVSSLISACPFQSQGGPPVHPSPANQTACAAADSNTTTGLSSAGFWISGLGKIPTVFAVGAGSSAPPYGPANGQVGFVSSLCVQTYCSGPTVSPVCDQAIQTVQQEVPFLNAAAAAGVDLSLVQLRMYNGEHGANEGDLWVTPVGAGQIEMVEAIWEFGMNFPTRGSSGSGGSMSAGGSQ